MTTLQQLLGTDLPVIQAPMAGVQKGALAAAVSEAGGLGSLPCAVLDAGQIRREVALIRARTDRPFNLNFFCHAPPGPDPDREAAWRALLGPYYRELGLVPPGTSGVAPRRPFGAEGAALVEELRPAVVSFHFGLPTPELLARVRGTGTRVLASATTVEEALWLEEHGVDGIIAQGLEAGGHRGMFLSDDPTTQMGTVALVRQVVQAVGLPVVAAGGIADAAGVTAALALGAAGHRLPALPRGRDRGAAPGHPAERRGPPHGADQRLHGTAGPGRGQPPRPRAGPVAWRRSRLPPGGARPRTPAGGGRSPGLGGLLAPVVRPERRRRPGGAGGPGHPRPGGRADAGGSGSRRLTPAA